MSTARERAEKTIANLVEKEGNKVCACSSVNDGLAAQMEGNGKRYRRILEIGTFHGVSAVVLTHFADTVITIDVTPPSERQALREIYRWLSVGMKSQIATVWVPDNDAKRLLVNGLDFDMAFIDGGHSELQTTIDFEITRRCGTLLFHDYPMSGSGCAGPGIVLDGARERGDGVVTTDPPFGWWRAG